MKYSIIFLSCIAFVCSSMQAFTYAQIRDAVRKNNPVLLATYLPKHQLTVKEMDDLRELSDEITKLKQAKVDELTDNVGKLIKYGRKYGKVALGSLVALISGMYVKEGWTALKKIQRRANNVRQQRALNVNMSKSDAELAVGLGAPVFVILAIQGLRFVYGEYTTKSAREQYLDAREVNQLLKRYVAAL